MAIAITIAPRTTATTKAMSTTRRNHMAAVYGRPARMRARPGRGRGARARPLAIIGMLSAMVHRDGHPTGHRCSCPRRVPVRGTVAVAR
jgi:hypothetical protein